MTADDASPVHDAGSQLTDPIDAAPAPTRIGVGFVLVLALANFGIWIALLSPVILTLQVKVAALIPDASAQPSVLAGVLVLGSVFGIVTNPIAGRLSDRTTSRLGMRRPWLIAGAIVAFVGAVVVGVAGVVPLLLVGWAVTMIGLNILLAVLISIVPDHVPVERRGLVSGMLGVGQALGGMVGAIVGGALSAVSPTASFVVPGAIALVTVLIAAFVIRDRRITRAQLPPFSFRAFVGSFVVDPRRHPDFGWAWISRFAMFLGLASVVNYQLYFLRDQLHLSAAEATALVPAGTAAQTVTIILVSIVTGPISDRLRRRKAFVLVSAVLGIAGLAVMAFAVALPMYFVAMVLIGIAQAVYFSVDLALVTDVLPDKETDAAKNIGVFNLSNLLPQFLAPAIAPALLVVPVLSLTGTAGQNYTVLFIAGAVFAAASAGTVLRVKGTR